MVLCDFTQTCLGMIIPHYEICPPCPPLSHLADNFRTPASLVFISAGSSAYQDVYIYKYFNRYILLCVYIWTFIWVLFCSNVIAPQILVGTSVSYHSNPSTIRLCGSPPVRPQLAKVVDILDTQKLIRYTHATNTNLERIRHGRRYRIVPC